MTCMHGQDLVDYHQAWYKIKRQIVARKRLQMIVQKSYTIAVIVVIEKFNSKVSEAIHNSSVYIIDACSPCCISINQLINILLSPAKYCMQVL